MTHLLLGYAIVAFVFLVNLLPGPRLHGWQVTGLEVYLFGVAVLSVLFVFRPRRGLGLLLLPLYLPVALALGFLLRID